MTFHWYFWPRVTSGDLATTFFEKLTSRASFWYISSLPCEKFKNLTQNEPKFEIWHQTGNFFLKFFLISHWSFWAIIWLTLTNLWLLIRYFKKGVGGTKIAWVYYRIKQIPSLEASRDTEQFEVLCSEFQSTHAF